MSNPLLTTLGYCKLEVQLCAQGLMKRAMRVNYTLCSGDKVILLALISCGCSLGTYSHWVSFISEVKIVERKIGNAGLPAVDRASNANAIKKEIQFKGDQSKPKCNITKPIPGVFILFDSLFCCYHHRSTKATAAVCYFSPELAVPAKFRKSTALSQLLSWNCISEYQTGIINVHTNES